MTSADIDQKKAQRAGELYREAEKDLRHGTSHSLDMVISKLSLLLGGTRDFPGPLWRRMAVPPDGKIVEHDYLTSFFLKPPREGMGFRSLAQVDFLVREGGRDGAEVLAMIEGELPNWSELVAADKAQRIAKEAQPMAKPGRPSKSEEEKKPSPRSIKYGETSEYLAARLRRDHPEIAAKAARGEFPSIKAAARAAGIVRKNWTTSAIESPADLAEAIRKKFDPDFVAELVSALRGSA